MTVWCLENNQDISYNQNFLNFVEEWALIIFKYKYYNNHLDIILTLVIIYIVDTNIYSLQLVVNIIVFKNAYQY